MEKAQQCYTGNGFKRNANFFPLTNFSAFLKKSNLLDISSYPLLLCDSHHAPSYEHAGNSQTGILVAETVKGFQDQAQVGVVTNERIPLFPLFKH